MKSTAKGTVVFAGYEGQYGYVVKVKHANNYETRYAHLTKPLVKRGQKIAAGDVIGLLGNTGRSTGPHLHYEILKNNRKVNPEKYLRAQELGLLPALKGLAALCEVEIIDLVKK